MSFPPPLLGGPAIEQADACLVLVHGRGAAVEGMLELYEQLRAPWCAAVAPQAPGRSWYPQSFLAPIETNEPYLDSSLQHLESVIAHLFAQKIPSERIALLGFSQGACLSAEFSARFPRRYGAIMALTGGLIGPAGSPRKYSGSLAKTPVFLGSSDPDPHVPFWRVEETRDVLSAMDASVEIRRYPGMGHTINAEELDVCRQLLEKLRR
jgi:phospholipase/carboxylesterase